MALIQTTEVERCLVTKQAYLTVEREYAQARCPCVQGVISGEFCPGFRVSALPLEARDLQARILMAGDRWIAQKKARGLEQYGTDLWVHGPFPSYNLDELLTDPGSTVFLEAEQEEPAPVRGVSGDPHPEKLLPMVFERDMTAVNPLVDYVFLGYFIVPMTWQQTRRTDTGDERTSFEEHNYFSEAEVD